MAHLILIEISKHARGKMIAWIIGFRKGETSEKSIVIPNQKTSPPPLFPNKAIA